MSNNRKTRTCLFILLFFVVIAALMYNRNFQTSHDDVWFPTNYAKASSLLDWIIHRYNNWSGRVAIEIVLPFVLDANVWLWRILNILFFLLMVTGITILGSGDRKISGSVKQWLAAGALLFTILIIERRVFEEGVFWATGSMNYLWPAACLCIALIPYSFLLSGKEVRLWYWSLVLPFAVYAAYQEQAGLILFCYSVVSLSIYRFRFVGWSVPGIILLAVITVNFGTLVFAPGNGQRMQHEIVTYYPIFTAVSFSYKAFHGINYTLLNHWFNDSVKIMLILVCLTLYLTKSRTADKATGYYVTISLFYVLVSIITVQGVGGDFSHFLNYDIYDYMTFKQGIVKVDLNASPLIIGIVILFSMPVIWYRIFKFSTSFIKLTLFYFASLFSSLVLSLSPTIFASSSRIFFIPDIMMVIVVFILFLEALQFMDVKKKPFIICYSILTVAGVTAFVKLL